MEFEIYGDNPYEARKVFTASISSEAVERFGIVKDLARISLGENEIIKARKSDIRTSKIFLIRSLYRLAYRWANFNFKRNEGINQDIDQ
jgi:hypothetical protein